MATGPTPWPKKGRWHWLLGVQTPEGREGHCHHRQSWLRLSACPRGARQGDRHGAMAGRPEGIERGGQRGRAGPQRGLSQSRWRRKRRFNAAIHALRMRVERTFAWEDKFKRLLLRFERIQQRHYGMKLLAYTLINLRKFCGT